MCFAEGVSASDVRNGFLVIHRHAAEGFPNVPGCSKRIRDAVGSLRITVDQAHLNGAERLLELPVAAVALIAKPRVLGPPVRVFGLPDVSAPATETGRFEA